MHPSGKCDIILLIYIVGRVTISPSPTTFMKGSRIVDKRLRWKFKVGNRCPDCNILIWPRSKYCVKCSRKRKRRDTSTSLHPGETRNDVRKRVNKRCVDCDILIAPQSTRCKSCEQKHRRGQGWSPRGASLSRICEICGIGFKAKKSLVNRGGGKYCSRECYLVYRRTILKGKKAWWIWKGGDNGGYGIEWNTELRRQIRKRDGNKCALCDDEYNGGHRLTVHHIDFGKSNNNPSNLVALCKSCHGKIHKNQLA